MYHNKKHLFFDMDDTVTQTRSPMEDHIYELYASIPHDLVIVSGAQSTQIGQQVRNLPVYRLGQNGNQAISPSGDVLWEEVLSDTHARNIQEHIQAIREVANISVLNENDLVEHRGAQISYSLIGHNEELLKKKACDPDKELRKSLLTQVPFICDDLEVKIGGTTCFDYFQKGKHKGFNVQRLITHMGWNKDACLYFGDALFPGGNDETVIGVIDTHPVADHLETFEILKKYFKK